MLTHRVKDFSASGTAFLSGSRKGHKELGGNKTRSADLNWPKG